MNTVVMVLGGQQKHSAMHIHVSILPQSPLPARFLRRRVSICSSRSSTVVPEPKQMSKNWGLEPQDAGFPTEFAFSVLCFGLMSSVCGAWEKMRTSHRSLAIGSTVSIWRGGPSSPCGLIFMRIWEDMPLCLSAKYEWPSVLIAFTWW